MAAGRRRTLTDRAVRQARPPATGRRELWDASLPGFGLRVMPSGKRSFQLVTRLRSGRAVRLTWRYPGISFQQARALARDALHAIALGADPRPSPAAPAPPRGVPPVPTVADVAAEFLTLYSHPRKRTWRRDELAFARYILPALGTKAIRDVTRRDVASFGDALAARHGGATANRTLALVKTLLAWALDRGLIDAHPAARLARPAPIRSRDRVLSDAEIAALWPVWSALGWPHGLALMVLLLTGSRRAEVAGMRRDEIDVATALWSIPAARTKTNRVHVVPLAPMTAALLASAPRLHGSTLVFTTDGTRAIGSWDRVVKLSSKSSGVTGWSPHDLRRTMRSGLSRLGVPSDVAERCLGHAVGGVRAVYDRFDFLDAKRAALEAWAAHVAALV